MALFSGGLSTIAATSWDRFTPAPPAPNGGDSGGECNGEASADLEVIPLGCECWPLASEAGSCEEAESRNLCVIWCCFMLPCKQRIQWRNRFNNLSKTFYVWFYSSDLKHLVIITLWLECTLYNTHFNSPVPVSSKEKAERKILYDTFFSNYVIFK
jgi:hypothetical protein